ncbi:hypothetical protein [Porphyromonas somerae]|nr:hypothetical protein [Porphyromonas somerae]
MEFKKNKNIEATGCNGLWFSMSFNYIPGGKVPMVVWLENDK